MKYELLYFHYLLRELFAYKKVGYDKINESIFEEIYLEMSMTKRKRLVSILSNKLRKLEKQIIN